MADIKVVWTTDAISTLRHRDRFSQIDILQDFEHLMVRTADPTASAIKIAGADKIYATRVLQGTYSVFWRWYDDTAPRVEVIAVGEKPLLDAAAINKLIKAESLAKEFA